MKFVILFAILFTCLENSYAQTFLAMDKYRFGSVKRLHVYLGTPLKYKTKETGIRTDTVTGMNDSILVFKNGDFVKLSEIETVYSTRTLVRTMRHWMSVAGAALIVIDSFNHLVNNERPIFVNRILVIGGSLIVAGQLLRLIETRRMHVGKRLRLHVIDLSLN
ncbi:MAG: hypothetical protein ACXVPQ_02695 [Bacteroidia bacterium]